MSYTLIARSLHQPVEYWHETFHSVLKCCLSEFSINKIDSALKSCAKVIYELMNDFMGV
jgi:hypothetical protein